MLGCADNLAVPFSIQLLISSTCYTVLLQLAGATVVALGTLKKLKNWLCPLVASLLSPQFFALLLLCTTSFRFLACIVANLSEGLLLMVAAVVVMLVLPRVLWWWLIVVAISREGFESLSVAQILD